MNIIREQQRGKMRKALFAISVLVLVLGFVFSSCGTSPVTKTLVEKGAYAISFPGIAAVGFYNFLSAGGEFPKLQGREITVEAWIKTNGGDGTILARGENSEGVILYVANNLANFAVNSLSVNSVTIVNDGGWHHVAGVLVGHLHDHAGLGGTCTSGAMSNIHVDIYVDGVLENCNGGSPLTSLPAIDDCTDLLDNPKPCTNFIGRDLSDVLPGGTPFNGTIDELRLWGEERTPEQIETWRHKEITVENWNQAGGDALAGYWRLNQGTGPTATDSSGYSNSAAKLLCVDLCGSGDPDNPEQNAPWDGGWVAGYPF